VLYLEDYHQEMTMNANIEVRLKSPAHPGGFIKHEIIEPLALSVSNAAEVLGVSRAALSALLNERALLPPEMALRIEKCFWRINGYADANAKQLRYRTNTQARRGNQSCAVQWKAN